MDKLKTTLILASGRHNSKSGKIAGFLYKELSKRDDLEIDIVNVSDFPVIFTNSPQAEKEISIWREKVEKSDAFIIVLPEYNRGYPGELKLLLDSAYTQYRRKPVSLVGVSSGIIGGARGVENLKPVLIEFSMTVCRNAVYFSKVGEVFDENDNLKDDSYIKAISIMVDELSWYGQVLKEGRNNYPEK